MAEPAELGVQDLVVLAVKAPALAEVAQRRPSLIILDIWLMGSKLDGLDLLNVIKEQHPEVPVIIISGYCGSKTVAEGLNAGADDYQRKPIAFDELAARIDSVLRRHQATAPAKYAVKGYVIGQVHLDFRTRTATGARGPLEFTELELQILSRFLQNPGKIFARDKLSRELFGPNWDPTTRALDVHMTRIRRKLCAAGAPENLIMTRRNIGYVLYPIVEITAQR